MESQSPLEKSKFESTLFIFKETYSFNILHYYVSVVLPLWTYTLSAYFQCVKNTFNVSDV